MSSAASKQRRFNGSLAEIETFGQEEVRFLAVVKQY